ncbi:MAG TPA: class I SAM-dependent methyltransferase [Anaerolineae bacterium]|mgnify:CR=1 FL=1|nr:class I SAM-dependent methyltransferase [Anaerolineae bacterium]HQK13156.1 class I SAM-dependent methyltransferase [Anaerolineae bacterium]
MNLRQRQHLEKQYHESDDKARDDNTLITRVYASGVFDEAENYHLEALGDIRGLHVLDYGCGGGWSTAKLKTRGARVTGFDISSTRLREAQAHLAKLDGSPVTLLECEAESLPFADATFDVIFGKQILHHLELEVAIAEIARVLRPGGKAVFLEPLIHNPLLEGYRRLTPHLRSPTEKALSMRQLAEIGAHFKQWSHREFCLFSILPILLKALILPKFEAEPLQAWLQKVDRQLVKAIPFLGRYYWETVIVLEK